MARESQVLDARKSAILRKVVEEHIETAQPVGSAHVVQDPGIDVSPATVRADMATLEREGYLTHPHTSAGRMPTDKGYRYFVDNLTGTRPLDPGREEEVASFFAKAHNELERMLRDTSQLLSRLTDYAAMVVAPSHEALTIRTSLLTRLGPAVALLVVVLSNGSVEKHVVPLEPALGEEELERASTLLREHLLGRTIGRVEPPEPSGHPAIDALVGSCQRLLTEANRTEEPGDEVFVGGTARMAEQFAAVETVRAVLSILEESFVVVTLLKDVLSQGQGVSIGSENGMASLAECSLVVAPYEVGDQVMGTIGVLGPTRMNYPQALAAVAVVSQQLGRRLAGG